MRFGPINGTKMLLLSHKKVPQKDDNQPKKSLAMMSGYGKCIKVSTMLMMAMGEVVDESAQQLCTRQRNSTKCYMFGPNSLIG
jgi:hypothetical protein